MYILGNGNLLGDEDLRNALYTIDIGQNDLDGVFGGLSYEKAILKIPDFIYEIENAIKVSILLYSSPFLSFVFSF